MKISELSTEQALDVLCEITPLVSEIISDEDLAAEVKKKIGDTEGLTRADIIAFGIEKLGAIANVLLKKKRDSVCAVLAAVNLTDAETIKKQNIIKTLSQIRELAKDKEFLAFVKSCRETEKSE